jgi:hypothetical protein
VTTAFVPKHYPRTRLASGRVLSDAQQHQYDVLRSVGGKLVNNPIGWFRLLSDSHRERLYGLNTTAMWKLVELGLAVCADDPQRSGYLFLLPDVAKDVPGPRYSRQGQIAKAAP